MANVAFKRGLSTALNAAGFTAADGVFYLTTDTHRLYVGQDSNLIELNRYVKVVATSKELPANPAKDDFAFVTEGNMLLICKDPSAEGIAKWTQINAQAVDTNTDTSVIGVKDKSVAVDTGNTGITVKFTFQQQTKNMKNNSITAAADIPVSFTISKENLAAVHAIAVKLGSAAISSGGSTVSLSGNGASASSVSLKPGSNVTITDDGKNGITFAAKDTTYSFGATGNNITLTTGGTSATQNVAVGGDTYVSATTASNKLSVAHKTYGALSATTQTAETLAASGNFTVVTGVSRDTGGHLTGFTTKQFTLPADRNTKNASATAVADNTGHITVTVRDSDNNTVTAKTANLSDTDAHGPLYLTVNGTKVFNQGSISFYTKGEIDSKFNGINAMTYKGTVGTGGTVTSLPTAGVKIGDTYMVSVAGTYATIACKVGDLLIATGTETGGVIADGKVTWTYVPSGDDTDTHYNLKVNGQTISLVPSTNPSTNTGTMTIAGGTDLTATGSDTTITIKHDAIGRKDTSADAVSGHGASFTAVTGVTTSATGHVTGITTTKVTMPGAQAVNHTLGVAEGHKIRLTNPSSGTSDVILANDSYITLTDDTTTKKITIGHKNYGTLDTPTPNAATLSHGGNFTVVTGVTRDNAGHITGYSTTKYTMPGDNNTQYKLSGSATAVSNVATISTVLKTTASADAGSSTFKLSTSSLKIEAASNNVSIDIEWGSF